MSEGTPHLPPPLQSGEPGGHSFIPLGLSKLNLIFDLRPALLGSASPCSSPSRERIAESRAQSPLTDRHKAPGHLGKGNSHYSWPPYSGLLRSSSCGAADNVTCQVILEDSNDGSSECQRSFLRGQFRPHAYPPPRAPRTAPEQEDKLCLDSSLSRCRFSPQSQHGFCVSQPKLPHHLHRQVG